MGATALLHDVEAETLQITRFSEGRRQEIPRICRFADRASHPPCKETLQIPRFHAECCKTQVLGPYHGGGGGSEPRTGIIYIYIYYIIFKQTKSSSFIPHNPAIFFNFTPFLLDVCFKFQRIADRSWRSYGRVIICQKLLMSHALRGLVWDFHLPPKVPLVEAGSWDKQRVLLIADYYEISLDFCIWEGSELCS